MRARDIMSTDVECVGTQETLADAARRLASRGVGAMPICDEDARLRGMLTDRDIVVKAVAKGKDVAGTLVGDLAQGKAVTARAADSVRDVVGRMESEQVRRLPVVEGHRLVGIVSQADIARNLSRRRAGDLVRGVSQPRGRGLAGRLVRAALIAAPLAVGVALVRRRAMAAPSGDGTITASCVVDAPVRAAYDQWTRFEQFPAFMDGVEEVRQVDDSSLHWRARVAGRERQWDARITEQVPDEVIAWRSTSGTRNDGRVRFSPLGDRRTRVDVQMTVQPESVADRVGTAIGLAERRVRADLDRYRELLEARGGHDAGGWRGEVHGERSA